MRLRALIDEPGKEKHVKCQMILLLNDNSVSESPPLDMQVRSAETTETWSRVPTAHHSRQRKRGVRFCVAKNSSDKYNSRPSSILSSSLRNYRHDLKLPLQHSQCPRADSLSKRSKKPKDHSCVNLVSGRPLLHFYIFII